MLTGARVFVFVIYALLGLSFIAQTAVLFWEFRDADWFALATHDSHLFVFFPTFGLVALAAFYVPSYVFVDMYWHKIRMGRLRFLIGFAVLAAAAWWIGTNITSSPYHTIWQIKPDVLRADRGEPANCGSNVRPCERIRLSEAITNVQQVSRARLGLKEFVRNCAPDPLLEPQQGVESRRFCFASTALSRYDQSRPQQLRTDAECCRSQSRLLEAINTFYEPEAQRSLTGIVHVFLLPLKVFFLLVLLAISILLALRHASVTKHYEPYLRSLEVGVLVGTFAMIFFPLMSQAFVQTADALYGTGQSSGFKPLVPLLSFAFGAWGLLILLFFYHRRDREVEIIAKLGGVVGSAVAVVKYDLISAVFVRVLGSGAGPIEMWALVVIAAICLVVLITAAHRRPKKERLAAEAAANASAEGAENASSERI